jgi:hypothetical protein
MPHSMPVAIMAARVLASGSVIGIVIRVPGAVGVKFGFNMVVRGGVGEVHALEGDRPRNCSSLTASHPGYPLSN